MSRARAPEISKMDCRTALLLMRELALRGLAFTCLWVSICGLALCRRMLAMSL